MEGRPAGPSPSPQLACGSRGRGQTAGAVTGASLMWAQGVPAPPPSQVKSRDITWLTKVHLVKVMAFPVVIYGCESWTIKKVEHQRIDAFEVWCWRRLLRVPWASRRSN